MNNFKVKLTKKSTISVPNTGAFTTYIPNENSDILPESNSLGTFFGIFCTVFLAMIIATVILSKGHSRVNFTNRKYRKNLHLSYRPRTIGTLAIFAIIILALVPLLHHRVKDNNKSASATNNILTITANDVSITADLASESTIYATSGKVAVVSPTEAGYTLGMYASHKDLMLSDSKKSVIKGMIGANQTSLPDNSWGVTDQNPSNKKDVTWNAVPTEESQALIIKTTSSATEANDTTTVYYGINVNNELEAGEYTGIINYIAVANPVTEPDPKTASITVKNGPGVEYTRISLNSGEDGGTHKICGGTAVCEYSLTIDESYEIEAGLSEGYVFRSWSDSNNAGIFGNTTSATTTYTVKANTTIEGSAESDIADDRCKPTGTTITEIKCMQDINQNNKTSILNSMEQNQQFRLLDSRDGKEYYVAKLADGNIWMTQNLDLDLGSNYLTSGSKVLTHADTDLGWGDTLDPAARWDTTNHVTQTTPIVSSSLVPISYDPGDLCWNGILSSEPTDYRPLEDRASEASCSNEPGLHYHVGNYYSWLASVALDHADDITGEDVDVNQSICPAGWMLPKSGPNNTESGSFVYLSDSLSLAGVTEAIQDSPTYLVYGGSWILGSSVNPTNYVGHTMNYWSSVTKSYPKTYIMSRRYDDEGIFSHSVVWNYMDDGMGFSVRCVTR